MGGVTVPFIWDGGGGATAISLLGESNVAGMGVRSGQRPRVQQRISPSIQSPLHSTSNVFK